MGGADPEAVAWEAGLECWVLGEDAALVSEVEGRGETIKVLVCAFGEECVLSAGDVGVTSEAPPLMVLVTVTVFSAALAVTVTVMNPPAGALDAEFAALGCAETFDVETLAGGAAVAFAPGAPVSCSAIVGLTRKAVESCASMARLSTIWLESKLPAGVSLLADMLMSMQVV